MRLVSFTTIHWALPESLLLAHYLQVTTPDRQGMSSLWAMNFTTDHISPAGSIRRNSPAGDYLMQRQVLQKDFNSYGSRRGNHEIMMRGIFANIRIRNEMVPSVEGGITRHYPSGEQMQIYDAAMRYKSEDVPLVVFGGKEYGMGSSRDWAAKGTAPIQSGRHGRVAADL